MIYEQPDEYHFSQDSTELACYALGFDHENESIRVIDVGAGCGIVGLQWARHYKNSYDLVLLEKQNVFYQSLKNNITISGCSQVIVEMSELSTYQVRSPYHVALSNPPYFLDQATRKSHCRVKQQCRHIGERDLKLWFEKVHELLIPGGAFFFSFRQNDWLENVDEGWVQTDSKVCTNYTLHYWIKAKS